MMMIFSAFHFLNFFLILFSFLNLCKRLPESMNGAPAIEQVVATLFAGMHLLRFEKNLENERERSRKESESLARIIN